MAPSLHTVKATPPPSKDMQGHAVRSEYQRASYNLHATVQLSRPVLTKSYRQEEKGLDFAAIQSKGMNAVADCCRLKILGRRFLSLFHILTWLPQYPWKDNLLPDLLAGLTVGIMSIPQGMAYARIAAMPPVNGLYTNIICPAVYALFGTTRHAAIGPATVLSLITSGIRYKHIPCHDCWEQTLNATNESLLEVHPVPGTELPVLTPIEVGTAIAFLVGVYLVIMGLFRLSFIADFLPDQLVGGFTVAAAVHVFVCQLKSIFGIPSLPHRNGAGKILMNLVDLFSSITETNMAALLIFLTCFVFLILTKRFVNPLFQARLRIPFPGEFIVMVIATVASYFGRFSDGYEVPTVRHIPSGLPSPVLPKFEIMKMLAADTAVLAVVTYTYSISLAKLYGARNGYRVRYTQEFFAYSFMNLAGSFFQCINSGQSVARSLVYEMAGAKSQLAGLFGTLVVIVTVLFVAPFLKDLPDAALAAIIVAACFEMAHNLKGLPSLFKSSKHDFAIFMVALLATVGLDVMYGLGISIIFALVTVILRSRRSRVELINEEARLLYTSEEYHGSALKKAFESDPVSSKDDIWDHVLILRPSSPIFYVNAEKVKNHLLEWLEVMRYEDDVARRFDAKTCTMVSEPQHKQPKRPYVIVVDMAAVLFMDMMGVKVLKEVLGGAKARTAGVCFCGCTVAVEKMMKETGLLDDGDTFLFPTVLDAIAFANAHLKDGVTYL